MLKWLKRLFIKDGTPEGRVSFRQFVQWCNERACDGCWGIGTAAICIGVMEDVKARPRREQNKFWLENFEEEVRTQVIEPINAKIKEGYG